VRAADLTPLGQGDLLVYNAKVAAPAPASASDDLWVTILSFDGGVSPVGPCRWQAPAVMPVVGALCLLILADVDATPWVPMFA
jgi:hypothetical protein